MSLENSSFRNIFGPVLLRASDNAEAALLFSHNDKTYEVVVLLNTNLRRVMISVHPTSFFTAITLAQDVWGEGCEGGAREAMSPVTTSRGAGFYITDAREAAEKIESIMT